MSQVQTSWVQFRSQWGSLHPIFHSTSDTALPANHKLLGNNWPLWRESPPTMPSSFYFWGIETKHFRLPLPFCLKLGCLNIESCVFDFFSSPLWCINSRQVLRAGQAPLVSGLQPNSISLLHSAKWTDSLSQNSMIKRWHSDELVSSGEAWSPCLEVYTKVT